MAKELKTKVTLDVKSATAKLDALAKHINKVNNAVNKTSAQAGKMTNALNKTIPKITQAQKATDKLANSASKVTKNYQQSNKAVGALTRNLRTMVSTYLGIMGARAVFNTSDAITSAENKLNYVNGNNAKLTQEAMDKTYAAAQRSRGGYMAMLGNVSKTMTLASDAFDGNIDNAIRFQEIMSKAYTVGGASAAEQASSMYQMVQALGGGILQGDELRSVREGAPIAYKEIEKFAQGVLNSKESLKELASQGLITSEIVVAAIMNAGESIDTAFENTEMTFAQALTNIQNMAVQAFTPVLQMLNKALNSDAGKAIINGIGQAFVIIANYLLWWWGLLGQFFNWCYENWYWLQWIVYAVILAIVVYLGIMAAQAVWAALKMFVSFIMGLSPLYLWIIMIGVVVGAIVWLANTTATACEFICVALLIVASAILLIGIITGSTALMVTSIIIAVIAILLGIFMAFGDKIIGGAAWIGAVIINIGLGIFNFFTALFSWIGIAFQNAVAGMINVGNGLWLSMQAIGENIGIAFENAWTWAKNTFWEFIADVLDGISALEPVINGIAKLIGKGGIDISGAASSMRSKKGSYKSFVSVGNAWNTGMNTKSYQSASDAWSKGWNAYEYINLSDAYNKGASVGANWQNKLENFGTNLKNKIAGFDLGDITDKIGKIANIGKLEGINKLNATTPSVGNLGGLGDDIANKLGKGGSYLPDPNDPKYGVGGSYDPDKVLDNIKNIAGDTSDIADSMELTEEDLKYLREVANMEWKKEFTTATIKVDMSNYNNINGDSDLDGIVTRLSDKLYEELNAVAGGVYV